MKLPYYLAVTMSLIAAQPANAQIMPEQAPVNVTVGGSGASDDALARLGAAAGEIETLNNLKGPSEGRSRNRTFINQYPIPSEDLGNMENYYLRSSYVTLGPKGFAPIHSHAERPAYLQVVSGTIQQHRSDGTSFVMGTEDFTFSSDGIAHWWSNESRDEPITLWIVELCTAGHGCEAEVSGGAEVLKTVGSRDSTPNSKPDVSIDLAGEFPAASNVGNRNLNLRRHQIPSGGSFNLANLGANPTYIRIFDGEMAIEESSRKLSQGSVFLSESGSGGRWVNRSNDTAILYSVEFER